jgi:hypothetical protein
MSYVGLAQIKIGRPDGSVSVFYEPQEKQDAFHLAIEPNVLYGGAAGGGKSHATRMDAYIRCMSDPGHRALILRRTWRELESTHIERAMMEAATLGAVYIKSEYRMRWPNGSVLEFGHCEDDTTVVKYLSTEFDSIYFDELVTFTLHQFKFISSRARSSRPGVKPVVKCASNPGGVNSGWVKRYFISKDVDPAEDPTYDPSKYRFIPATLDDNKYIDPTYEARLMALPTEALRRAYRYGDWDVFDGQYFSEWRALMPDESGELQPWHVIPEEPTIDGIPISKVPWIEHFRAIDWGYRDMCVVGWYACLPDGRLIKTRELAINGTLARDVARKVKQLSRGMKIRYTVADPSMWNKDGKGMSTAEIFARERVPLIPAANDRVNGWQRLHDMLRTTTVSGDRFVPMLQFVGPTCPYTCRTIPTLVADEHKPEDVKTKGTEDHAADETRYAVMSRFAPSKKRKAVTEEPPPWSRKQRPGTVGDDLRKLIRGSGKRFRLGSESAHR